jgi:hypothetical protein
MNKNTQVEEWKSLQEQFDSYEKYSLWIKLFAIGVLVYGFANQCLGVFTGIVMLVLWLQDAIWKTYQGRFEDRLLTIETEISEKSEAPGCQFNRTFLQSRLSGAALIKEYIHQGVRPTVAYPYLVLCVMNALAMVDYL